MTITKEDIIDILDNCYCHGGLSMFVLDERFAAKRILNLIEQAQYEVIQNLGKEIFQKVLGIFDLNLTKEEIKQNIENLAEVYIGEGL